MNYARTTFFAEEIEEDDIDALFSQLQQIEPPATLIEDILASVDRLGVYGQPRITRKLWVDMNLVEFDVDLDAM
jgi:hypothetical protein